MKEKSTIARNEIIDNMYEIGSFKQNILSFIKARVPMFTVNTNEEKRFISYMDHFTQVKNMKLYAWNVIHGLINIEDGDGIDLDNEHTRSCASEQERILAYIENEYKDMQRQHAREDMQKGIRAYIYILLDFNDMLKYPRVIRRLKTIYNTNSTASVILVGNNINNALDSEMQTLIPSLSAPMAEKKELKAILDEMVGSVSQALPNIIEEVENKEEKILQLVSGKTIAEAQHILSNNVVTHLSFLGEQNCGQKKKINQGKETKAEE